MTRKKFARHLAVIDAALARRRRVKPPADRWLGWLFVALARHRIRQRWHAFIVRTRLRDVEEDEGDVPGLAGWTYAFSELGCCLEGPDGEVLDVDFDDDEAAIVDTWRFADRLESLSERGVEGVVARFLPTAGLVVIALADAAELGAIEQLGPTFTFRLAPELEERAAAIAAIDFEDSATLRFWSEALGDPDDEAVWAGFEAWLCAAVRSDDLERAREALDGAARLLPRRVLATLCLELVARVPLDEAAREALQILSELPDVDAREEVRAYLRHERPADARLWGPFVAVRYLLDRGDDDPTLLRRFDELSARERAEAYDGSTFLGDWAVLALEHRPGLAMALVRRALRSPRPACVAKVAALLSAIGQPWCVRELAAALDERPRNATLAEALRRTSGDLARAKAARSYVEPIDEARDGFVTHERLVHLTTPILFERLLVRARGRGDRLRERFPPSWDGG